MGPGIVVLPPAPVKDLPALNVSGAPYPHAR
jgi:hypothetical protein